jgi:LysM repeat protein
MGIERAKIFVFAGDGKSNKLVDEEGIEVCFNPNEYSLEKSVNHTPEKAKADAKQLEFTETSAMTLSVTLKFDTYEERVSVREKYTKKIEKLTMMRGEADQVKDSASKKEVTPPVILFMWGKFKFKGVIASLTQKYTMFLSDGTPVRAECTLSIREAADNVNDAVKTGAKKEPETGKPYTVKEGDRLDSIAAEQLDDPSRWSEIAMLNGIDDPLDIEVWLGRQLTMPK